MVLRKINAGLSLITTVLLMGHTTVLSVWMLSRCSIEKHANAPAYELTGLMILHAVISVLLMVRTYRGVGKKTSKGYPQLNPATIVQRVTSVLMLLLIGVHLTGAANHYQPKMLYAVMYPLFFAAALAHVSVSTSKALITLGIGNAKALKIVDVVVRILCIAAFVASVIGFYLCLFMGVAK